MAQDDGGWAARLRVPAGSVLGDEQDIPPGAAAGVTRLVGRGG